MKKSSLLCLELIAIAFLALFFCLPKLLYREEPTPTPYVITAEERTAKANDVTLYRVNSSCFSEIGYDFFAEILVVRFKDSGVRYAYYDFPGNEYGNFYKSDSYGEYYQAYIKGKYVSERLD